MLSSPVAVIDAAGITVPTYTDVLEWLQEQYMAIYGFDIDIDADTQDGQWIAVLAQSIHDANQTVEATYHAYSPTYAQGVGLSSIVKINGIRRHVATHGTVLVTVVGIAGTDCSGGIITSLLEPGIQWQLPLAGVIIPPEGQLNTTATCLQVGANRAGVDTLDVIVSPVPGWQTVTNPNPATPGLPVESDADLRRRQTYSVANPSQTVVIGIQGSIASVEGVKRAMVYENATSVPDSNGIPPYSIACVVEGGDSYSVAEAIALRKTPGSPTFGTTEILYYDQRGIPAKINYFPLTLVPITVNITLSVLPGFSESIADAIAQQVIDYLNELPIGYNSFYTKLIAATELQTSRTQYMSASLTYEVTAVAQARDGGTPQAADINISYIEACYCEVSLVTMTVNQTPGAPLRRLR